MGEWSEYFEDFPEENPDNWVNGVFLGPHRAREYHARKMDTEFRVRQEQAKLNAEISRMIAEGNARAKAKMGKSSPSA